MKIQKHIEKESKSILNLPTQEDAFEDAIATINFFVHEPGAKGKVVTSGMGKAGHIAHNIAMTLSSTGTPAVFIHPSEAQHGDLGIMRHNDVLLVLSNSGKTREIIEFIDLARNMYPHTQVISITGCRDCELTKKSDVVLLTNDNGNTELDKFGLVPTISTTLMSVIGDILVVELMDKIGFTKEQYSKLHHSGYIGSTLKKQ